MRTITIHQQIEDYIKGHLTKEEIDHLWMNFLYQQVWYDYFITELTAHSISPSTNNKDENQVNHQLLNLVENKPYLSFMEE